MGFQNIERNFKEHRTTRGSVSIKDRTMLQITDATPILVICSTHSKTLKKC